MKRLTTLTLFALLLSACGTHYRHGPTAAELHGQRGALRPGADYIVRPGDTLFGISWRYGLDMQEFARWNGISDPNRILVGQRLHTQPPRGVMRTPVYTPQISSAGQPGWSLKITGSRGQAIRAARDGEVAYVGSGLSGFGRMVILRHEDKVLSAYGYLADVQVSEKQRVQRGQQIATMGISPQNIPALHFETRKQGQSVNPYAYIGTTPRY